MTTWCRLIQVPCCTLLFHTSLWCTLCFNWIDNLLNILVFSVPSQEIGWEECLRNDVFCIEWDVKPYSVQFYNGLVCCVRSHQIVRMSVCRRTSVTCCTWPSHARAGAYRCHVSCTISCVCTVTSSTDWCRPPSCATKTRPHRWLAACWERPLNHSRPSRCVDAESNWSVRHTHARTHAHTHRFNGPLSGTARVGRYQKGKINLGPDLQNVLRFVIRLS